MTTRYSQVPNKRVYSFIPNERVGLLFWANFIGLNKRVGWKKCEFIWAYSFMKFAQNNHPTHLFGPTRLFGTWEYETFNNNGILLPSGLNPAWHFWLSTRFSCCLKMKSVENILGYIREQFYRFSRGCKPRENLWNCSRKYTKMFKTDSFLDNKKLSFNQNVWRDHATMQQDVLLHFWVIFLHWNQAEIWKNYSVVQL